MTIIPAILEQSPDAFIKRIHELSPHFPHLHVDIADGKFVPNKTVQIEQITHAITNRQLPTNNTTFHFHLMVDNYTSELKTLQLLSSSIMIGTIFIHLAAFINQSRVGNNDHCSLQIGIVLNPEDEILPHWEKVKQFSTVQLMTVHPGFQGAPFIPLVLRKIEALKNLGFEGKIVLDGGINDKILSLIIENPSKPDILCVGSFLKENIDKKIQMFRDCGIKI